VPGSTTSRMNHVSSASFGAVFFLAMGEASHARPPAANRYGDAPALTRR
jgi:hypothetical protein